MTKRMLVDATHDEEVRVAVIEGDRLEEFEYESQFRKPLKGNIFLAKVTRVEPSLQAAFVNFGGNRHGFLPFSEIHPDYFRIPISDREALIEEQEKLMEQAEEEDEDEDEDEESNDDSDNDDSSGNKKKKSGRGRRGGKGRRSKRSRRNDKHDESPEDAERRFRFNLRRKYKIQEVIKRGQIMLVQVSKEERGNKGAAVGSYLSLPGRYCVLMPNSPRAGGVSRKIANSKDRNRMRDIMRDLEVPKGMSVILRTAGMSRTKTEIKRDLDYLIKLWNQIRELTLESSAPSLVYEEADLIKRAIRDIYTRDVDEVHVAGKDGFKVAKNFMKLMIPSHAKKVKEYKDKETPLFNRYQVERQIAEIGETQVTLPSGGYLVINPTEALVSVDVNSGRATKERHIEETALKTNLEAAHEVARQLRLRDLGGLVVIDFIDMEDRRNNNKVERKMKDALSEDRARVQVGRISSFGLMELSRQRLNPSLTEAQFGHCPNCDGTGRVRTADATSIMVLRAIEDEGIKNRAAQIIVHVSSAVALYILNNKRKDISRLEKRYDFEILIRVDDEVGESRFRVEVSKPSEGGNQDSDNNSRHNNNDDDDDNSKGKRSRGRRGRRGGRGRNNRRNNDDSNNKSDNDSENKKDESSKDNEKDDQKNDKKSSKGKDNQDKDDKPKKRGRPSKKDKEEAEKKDDDKSKKKSSPKKSSKKKDDDDKAAKEDKPKKKAAAKKKSPAKKSDDKKSDDKADAKKDEAKSESKKGASNDDEPDDSHAREHEVVNKVSGDKKKGWWSRVKGE